jgi:UDPglucose 6-dehydrogenase
VAEEIGPLLLPGTIIVNKSTVPVGSTLVVERVLGRHDVTVVSNPEFLREGTAVADSLHPERIVVGADDQAAAAKVGDLFAGTHAPLLITDAATAETIKYASNAFLATKLSFVNAVAGLCEAVGADVRDVILGLGYDKRIGFEYLRPGPGWGGSCLPKDTKALVHIAEQAGYDFSFLRGAIATNDEQFVRVVDKVSRAVGGDLEGTVIAAWGLTFKAGTDDLRNSPAVEVVRRLVEGGAVVRVFDPTVPVPEGEKSAPIEALSAVASAASGGDLGTLVHAYPDVYAACDGASVAVVLTEWDEFRWLDFARVHATMANPVVVDARNLLDPAQLRRIGFEYTGIGRR